MKKRAVAEATDAPDDKLVKASKLFEKLPNVLQFLSVSKYDDGTPRKPGWITIAVNSGLWYVTAKDPDSAGSLRLSAVSLDDALRLCNDTVLADGTIWQQDPWLLKKLPKKRGK